MANPLQQLIEGYENWIAIVQSQISILLQERNDHNFEQLSNLEMKKRAVLIQVMESSETMSLVNADNRAREKIRQYVEQLLDLNQKAQVALGQWYNDASNSMKQVSTHRRTLQSYGGVNYSDVISYFIDSKK